MTVEKHEDGNTSHAFCVAHCKFITLTIQVETFLKLGKESMKHNFPHEAKGNV